MRKKEEQDRQYTDEFKIEAVRLAESIGGNQAAKRLGMPESSLHNWVRLKRAGKLRALNGAAVPAKRPVSELEAENARLRRELASAKLDLDIVKRRRRISRRSRGEICLDGNTQRPVQRKPDEPALGRVAHWLLSVASACAKRALDRQRNAGCAGRSDTRGDETQLRSAAHRAGSARERCSRRP